MLDADLLRQAEKLASRPYQSHIFLDKSTEGEPVYVALVPEMPGCHTHGDTVKEAKEWLESAKVDFIYFLLEDGLPVPDPCFLDSYTCVDMSDFSEIENESAPFSSIQVAG